MLTISAQKLTEILESPSQVGDFEINNVVTDSRQVQPGDLFIAIKGINIDAHDYVSQVMERGAALAVVERMIPGVPQERLIVVPDSTVAFGKLGAYVRSQFRGTVIAMTGSAGKTTVKEELKLALEQFGKVYATPGNLNNCYGLPRTLCDMDMEADYAVIELGMSAKGEIECLVDYVKPDMAVVTNVYPMHIEFFPNFEAVAEAKAEIFNGLKTGGKAVLNAGTNFADLLEQRATEKGLQVFKFVRNEAAKLNLQQDGDAPRENAACVLKVIEALGLDKTKVIPVLESFGALEGRGKKWTLHLPKEGNYTLIDDSYSGQPEAMLAAIANLENLRTAGRKIAVIGKMAELGETSQARHIEVGQALAKTNVEVVVGVCPETRDVLMQLRSDQKACFFENKDGLDEFLLNKLLQNNDIVLIKGARYSSKLYQVAEALIKRG